MTPFAIALTIIFLSVPVTAWSLLRVTAPYGRHSRKGWGPTMDTRLAWVLMESPAVVAFALCFVSGSHIDQVVPWIFFLLWQTHYVDRTVLYPLRMRAGRATMPLAMIASGFIYNTINGFLNGTTVSHVNAYSISWLVDPRFLVGVALFITGFAINRRSDAMLKALRKPGETSYRIPRGELYRYISCPNYFGEILQWCGWAIATWSLAGLSFALFTAANLIPRALANHRWYIEQFPDYPAERRAVIPFLL